MASKQKGKTDKDGKCPKCGDVMKWVKHVNCIENGMWETCQNLDCGFKRNKAGKLYPSVDWEAGRPR